MNISKILIKECLVMIQIDQGIIKLMKTLIGKFPYAKQSIEASKANIKANMENIKRFRRNPRNPIEIRPETVFSIEGMGELTIAKTYNDQTGKAIAYTLKQTSTGRTFYRQKNALEIAIKQNKIRIK